ncbi:MAG TPA: acetate--CoA ligase family protein [Trebonia sp.]|jgi:acyl-CoA synthetase (NDP forming)|nr:acetate--CoA ligase family protein [Trebonia sp.]
MSADPATPPRASASRAERLRDLFHPPAVTLVGATPNSHVTRVLLDNFTRPDRPFPGPVNLVNPRRGEVLGHPAVPALTDVAGDLGLVYLLLSPAGTQQVVDEAAALGLGDRITGLIAYAAGFGESGNKAAEKTLADSARALGVPLLGPQSTGIISAPAGLLGITDPVPEQFVPGRVGFVAQSTGLLGGAASWLLRRGVGLGLGVGFGNGAGVTFADLGIAMLADPGIDVVCVYSDAVSDVATLVELGAAAREAGKPVIVFPGAGTPASTRAAQSHSGVLATGPRMVRGVAAQHGVLLAEDFEELLWAAELFVRPGIRELHGAAPGIFTASGGGGIIAAASLEEAGLTLPEPAERTRAVLGLAPGQSGNPYDIGAISLDTPDAYARNVQAFAADPAFDVVIRPASLGAPSEKLANHRRSLTAFMEGVLAQGKLPVIAFPYPEDPREYVDNMPWEHALVVGGRAELGGKLRLIERWAALRRGRAAAAPGRPAATLPAVRAATAAADQEPGLRIAGPAEAEEILAPLGVRWPRSVTVSDADGVPAALARLGWPRAAGERLVAKTAASLSHRANAGGVLLGLRDKTEIQAAVTLLAVRFDAPVVLTEEVPHRQSYFLGFHRDGPDHAYLAFGPGVAGDDSEVELRLCPLSPDDARGLEDYVRRASAPPPELGRVLTALSELAATRRDIEVIDINPLVTDTAGRLTVLDVKAYLRAADPRTETVHGPAAD